MTRPIIILTIIILFSFSTKTFGQGVTINLGVDTTDQDIKAVITVWTNYLKSKPNKDNIKESPFWADTEKKFCYLYSASCLGQERSFPPTCKY